MFLLSLSMCIVSVAKCTGALTLLIVANQLCHIAFENAGFYLFLYVVAVYLVVLSGLCLYQNAVEFVETLLALFDDEDNVDM